jgi:hypothetical protein
MAQPIKRYRVKWLHFDLTFNGVRHDVQAKGGLDAFRKAPELLKEMHAVAAHLNDFGWVDPYTKIQNAIDIGALPLSIVAFHNQFIVQLRDAFVRGDYYPALTASVALGERILNHMVLRFREGRAAPKNFRTVHKKSTFQNWHKAIDALRDWDILAPEAEKPFRELHEDRNEALHFDPLTEANTRAHALEAYGHLANLLKVQFGAFGGTPWLFVAKGASFVRKEYEQHPFVRAIYIPQCWYVGPHHRLDYIGPGFEVKDDPEVLAEVDTDEEFASLVR